jgi:hypothetical protein
MRMALLYRKLADMKPFIDYSRRRSLADMKGKLPLSNTFFWANGTASGMMYGSACLASTIAELR